MKYSFWKNALHGSLEVFTGFVFVLAAFMHPDLQIFVRVIFVLIAGFFLVIASIPSVTSIGTFIVVDDEGVLEKNFGYHKNLIKYEDIQEIKIQRIIFGYVIKLYNSKGQYIYISGITGKVIKQIFTMCPNIPLKDRLRDVCETVNATK